jgi:enoyl-CoA hydratase/carnithine racemase
LPATRRHELGIIARVAEPDDLQDEAQKIVDRLAANAPLSLRNMKAMMVRQMAFRDATNYDDLNADVAKVAASADAKEGVRAKLDRRQPDFRGE